jgi:hypothetical protein
VLNSRRALGLMLLPLAMMGCAYGTSSRLAAAPPKPYPCQLQTFATEADVPRRFVAVCSITEHAGHGILFDTGSEQDARRDAALRGVRQRACACGADAVIMTLPASYRSPIDALAIRYTE